MEARRHTTWCDKLAHAHLLRRRTHHPILPLILMELALVLLVLHLHHGHLVKLLGNHNLRDLSVHHGYVNPQ